MTTLYVIIKVLTLPGTYVKAFFEHVACRVYEVLIEDGRYLPANEMCGHIEHELIKRRGVSFGVCFFPFIFNLLIGLVFISVGSMNVFYVGEFFTKGGFVNIVNFVFLWCGISFLTNLFPSLEDALTLKGLIYSKESKAVVKIFATPIFAILFCGAYLERYCVTFLTSIALSLLVPEIFAHILPIFA